MNDSPIYLDYAAATPLDSVAVSVMQTYGRDRFYNPSAVYQAARDVRKQLEKARADVASVLGAKDQEVVFTAGGTEANNLAIHGVMKRCPDANLVISSIEHESVLEPAKKYERRFAPVTKKGQVDLAKLDLLIDEKTVLVSIMYANNEVGTIQSLKEVAALIQRKRAARTNDQPLYLHTDACQAANYLDLQVSRLGVDLMTLNGGKIYGPKQSGCLYVRAGVELDPLILGGGQELGLRSGTENVGAQIAFATMLQKVQSNRKTEQQRLQQISKKFYATLSHKYSEIFVNGDEKKRLPNNLNITIPGVDGERLLMELDNAGIMVATGSACTASNDEPSHVLLALGLSEQDASSSIRITFGANTTESDAIDAADRFLRVLQTHVRLV